MFLIVNLTSKMTSECFCVASRPAGQIEEVRLHSRLFAVFVFLTLISGSVLVLHRQLLCTYLNTFAPEILPKNVLKLVKWFSGHCGAIKS